MNIALVGCAHIHTPNFVKKLSEREGVEVNHIWDHDASRAAENAAILGSKVVEDVSEIWKNDETEAVVICSETDRHKDLVLGAAGAGKHMFVEKPLGLEADDAYIMADAISKAGVLFQTGYFNRGRPEYRFLRSEIRRGHLGKITRIRMSNCHAGAIRDFFTPKWLWMTDLEQAGVGAFGDLGTHVLDIAMWLIDSPVTRVAASLETVFDKYGPECDEYGEGIYEYENGVIGSIAAGWVDVADPVKLVISGTEGCAYYADRLYYKSSHVDGAAEMTEWTDLDEPWPHAFDMFLDAVAGSSPPKGEDEMPLVDAHEAARRSDVMAAFYRAAQTGSWAEPERE